MLDSLSHTVGRNINWYNYFGGQWQYLPKSHMHISFDPAYVGIYPVKILVQVPVE